MKLLSQAELSASTIKQLCSNWLVYDRLIMAGDWKECVITYREATAFRDLVDNELWSRNSVAWKVWQKALTGTNQKRWSPAQYFNPRVSSTVLPKCRKFLSDIDKASAIEMK